MPPKLISTGEGDKVRLKCRGVLIEEVAYDPGSPALLKTPTADDHPDCRRPASGLPSGQRGPVAGSLVTGIVAVLGALAVATLLGLAGASAAWAEALPPTASRWSAGAAVGFLANSPDGPEPAVAGYAAYELSHGLSVGPLVQLAGPGNDRLAGLSLQARYRRSPGGGGRLALVVQGGLGVLWADIEDTDHQAAVTDTSFVIPLGLGLEYALTPRVAFTADLLVNLTSLGDRVQAGGQEVDLHTYVMPGLFLGLRF